jgi:RNA recognition motif-containing protein
METKLYVGNLSYETTEDDLRSLFTQVGTVNEVALIKDRDTGSSKGFAFVTMNSQDEANKAISQFNGQSLGNRELKVNAARPRESNYDSNQGSGNQSNSSRNRSGGGQRY